MTFKPFTPTMCNVYHNSSYKSCTSSQTFKTFRKLKTAHVPCGGNPNAWTDKMELISSRFSSKVYQKNQRTKAEQRSSCLTDKLLASIKMEGKFAGIWKEERVAAEWDLEHWLKANAKAKFAGLEEVRFHSTFHFMLRVLCKKNLSS